MCFAARVVPCLRLCTVVTASYCYFVVTATYPHVLVEQPAWEHYRRACGTVYILATHTPLENVYQTRYWLRLSCIIKLLLAATPLMV